MSAQLQKINQLKFTSNTLSEKILEERKTTILFYVEKHPELKQLVQSALQKGDITVSFEDLRPGFTASCLLNLNIIFINPNTIDTLDVLDYFVFELCNLTNTKLVAEVDERQSFFEYCLKKAPHGYSLLLRRFPDALQYAKAVEEAEYLTDVRAAKLIQSGIKMYGWPKPKEGQHVHDNRSWQKYLEEAIYPTQPWPKQGITHLQRYMSFYYRTVLNIIRSDIKALTLGRIGGENFIQHLKILSDAIIKLSKEHDFMLENSREHAFSVLKADIEKQSIDLKVKAEIENNKAKPVAFAYETASLSALAVIAVGAASYAFSYVTMQK